MHNQLTNGRFVENESLFDIQYTTPSIGNIDHFTLVISSIIDHQYDIAHCFSRDFKRQNWSLRICKVTCGSYETERWGLFFKDFLIDLFSYSTELNRALDGTTIVLTERFNPRAYFPYNYLHSMVVTFPTGKVATPFFDRREK